jgi:hypothetical protein
VRGEADLVVPNVIRCKAAVVRALRGGETLDEVKCAQAISSAESKLNRPGFSLFYGSVIAQSRD